MGLKILMVAPHHASMHRGGAEVASSRLAEALRLRGNDVWELAAASEGMDLPSTISALSDHKYLLSEGYSDGLRFTSARSAWANRELIEWMIRFNPDVIHFHHFVGVGSDLIFLARHAMPGVRIVFTAHEMLAMCARDGKMVRRDGSLCHRPSNVECTACVDEAPVSLFLRDEYMGRVLRQADVVTAPSVFLSTRLAEWMGTAVAWIPNCPPNAELQDPRPLAEGEGRSVFGFFGQIIPSKGLHLLLAAMIDAKRDASIPITLLVFGTRPDAAYWEQVVEPSMAKLAKGVVRVVDGGAYIPEDAVKLMGLVDWVCVPSLWWENAPTVVLEAVSAGRPVLANDLGGMAEALAVTSGGKTVANANAIYWSRQLQEAADPERTSAWDAIRSRMRLPWTAESIADQYLDQYSSRDE